MQHRACARAPMSVHGTYVVVYNDAVHAHASPAWHRGTVHVCCRIRPTYLRARVGLSFLCAAAQEASGGTASGPSSLRPLWRLLPSGMRPGLTTCSATEGATPSQQHMSSDVDGLAHHVQIHVNPSPRHMGTQPGLMTCGPAHDTPATSCQASATPGTGTASLARHFLAMLLLFSNCTKHLAHAHV